MSKSTLVTIVVVAILIIGGAVALTRNSDNGYNSPPPTSNPTSSSSNQAASSGSVDIKNRMFTPSQITVRKGGKVTWTNSDNTAHTVTDDLNNVGGPASGNIEPGSTYSFTFNKAGSYQYHCEIHHSMRGTIVVR